MKKIGNKVLIVIIAILLFGIGLTLGLAISAAIVLGETKALLLIFEIICAAAVGIIVSIIVHEAGHLVCGLISGYRFSSFRIFSLMLIKQDGKMHLRRFSIPGTGGQCLLIPPKNREYPPFTLYLYGGTIANLLLAAVSIPLCFIFGLKSVLSIFIILIGAFSLYFAFTNGIPREMGGISNDAMNVRLMRSDKVAQKALMTQLLINDAQTRGKRLSEMPDEWFMLPENADFRNVLISTIRVYACNRLMDQERFEEANEAMKALLASRVKLPDIFRYMLRCDRIYCELLLKGSDANISSMYTKYYRRFAAAMGSNPSIMRTEYAVRIIRDKDKEEADKVRQKFRKKEKHSPFPQETKLELHFMDLAYKRIFGSENE